MTVASATSIASYLTPRYQLDTGILLAIGRGGDMFRRIEARYQLVAAAMAQAPARVPFVSLVSVAEINSIALYNNWSSSRITDLNTLLARFVIVPVDGPEIIERYARMDVFSRRNVPSRVMGKNDLWIAVAANLTGATLLTNDGDFDHLNGHFINTERVDV